MEKFDDQFGGTKNYCVEIKIKMSRFFNSAVKLNAKTSKSSLILVSIMASATAANGSLIGESLSLSTPELPVNEQIDAIQSALQTEHGEAENPCTNLNLSDLQRAQINHMAAQSRDRFEHFKRQLMETRKAYGHNIVAGDSNPERAHRLDAHSDEITKNLSAIGHNLITGILFHVVSADQKLPTAHCIQYTQREQMKRRLKEICEQLKP